MVKSSIILDYFPHITEAQKIAFAALENLYIRENEKVNLISRKDMDFFYVHHVLHSLALVKYGNFQSGQKVIDIGTGGGFPGIPLAIMYPDTEFLLCDSIGKKIKAVEVVAEDLNLENVIVVNGRTEALQLKFDTAVARAVAPASKLWGWMIGKWINRAQFYLLKGGDLELEMKELKAINPKLNITISAISDVFSEEYFETKKVVSIR